MFIVADLVSLNTIRVSNSLFQVRPDSVQISADDKSGHK